MNADSLAGLLPLVLLVGVFWFLVLRPARKRQRDAMTTQDSLTIGARVMLTSGIFGTVVAISDDTFQLEISPGTVVTALRPAVARVVPAGEPDGPATGRRSAPRPADEPADDAGDTDGSNPDTNKGGAQ